jgi:hypothetical protein
MGGPRQGHEMGDPHIALTYDDAGTTGRGKRIGTTHAFARGV